MENTVHKSSGLNGSGGGLAPPPGPTPEGEADREGSDPCAVAPQSGGPPPAPRRFTSRVAAIMADPTERAELRRRVCETTNSYHQIARDFGAKLTTLTRRVTAEGWLRPEGAPVTTLREDGTTVSRPPLAASLADAGAVRFRLLRAVDRQVAQIESRARKRGASIEERDARMLGNLAKTLSTLMEIGEGGATSKDAEPQNRDELEADLARRIEKWARGGEEAQ